MYIFDKAWVLFTSKYRFEKTRHSLIPVKDILFAQPKVFASWLK